MIKLTRYKIPHIPPSWKMKATTASATFCLWRLLLFSYKLYDNSISFSDSKASNSFQNWEITGKINNAFMRMIIKSVSWTLCTTPAKNKDNPATSSMTLIAPWNIYWMRCYFSQSHFQCCFHFYLLHELLF